MWGSERVSQQAQSHTQARKRDTRTLLKLRGEGTTHKFCIEDEAVLEGERLAASPARVSSE